MEQENKQIKKFVAPETKARKVFSFLDAGKNSQIKEHIEAQDELMKITGGNLDSIKSVDRNNEEILSDVVVKDKLEQVAELSTPKKRRKNTILSICLLLVNIVVVFFLARLLFKSADDASLANLIAVQGDRLKYLYYALGLFVVLMLADALFISRVLKATTGKFRPWLALRTSIIGKYYEAITPLSAGGQPSQILYLAKRKVSPGIATSVPIIRITLINFMSILIATFLFIFVVPSIVAVNSFWGLLYGLLKILAYIGLIVNLLFLVVMFIIINSKALGRSLARNVIKFGYKLHLIKNYRVAYKKFMNQVAEYQNSMNYLKKHIGVLITSFFSILIEILAISSVPFFVTLAIGDASIIANYNMWEFYLECLAKYYICYMASAYIPLPGGTGMMEMSFVILFASIIGPNFVVWGFLIWRLVSYYITIVQGFILTIADTIASGIKAKKELKQ